MSDWCARCGAGMVRNGTRKVGFRDLSDGVGTEASASVQRMACRRCDGVAYREGPRLEPGTRVTPALARAVAADCVTGGFSEVARRHGLDPRTVRGLWDREIASLTAAAAHPRMAQLRIAPVGSRRVAVVRDRHGTLVAAFGGALDARFAAWASSHPGGLLVSDWRHATAAAAVASPGLLVACDRTSVLRWFDDALDSVAAKARRWMPSDERRRLREAWPALVAEDAGRSPAEDDMLREAGDKFPLIAELQAGVDGFRRAMRQDTPQGARERMVRWRAGLSAFGRDVFSLALAMVDRMSGLLFGPGWREAVVLDGMGAPELRLAAKAAAPDDERTAQKVMVSVAVAAGARASAPSPQAPRPAPPGLATLDMLTSTERHLRPARREAADLFPDLVDLRWRRQQEPERESLVRSPGF